MDTNNGATDAEDGDCDWYLRHSDHRDQCGNLDDDDFKAKDVCCACGGIFLLRISDINNVFLIDYFKFYILSLYYIYFLLK